MRNSLPLLLFGLFLCNLSTFRHEHLVRNPAPLCLLRGLRKRDRKCLAFPSKPWSLRRQKRGICRPWTLSSPPSQWKGIMGRINARQLPMHAACIHCHLPSADNWTTPGKSGSQRHPLQKIHGACTSPGTGMGEQVEERKKYHTGQIVGCKDTKNMNLDP